MTEPAQELSSAAARYQALDLSRAVFLYRFLEVFRRCALFVTIALVMSLLLFPSGFWALRLCLTLGALAFTSAVESSCAR